MKVAVVTGVYNEEKTIGALIESVLNQTYVPDEMVIVDDGSKDKTAEIVKKYAAEEKIIKYIYQENAGPAKARNKGWKSADTDICVFTDGDCVPEKIWVEELLKPFKDKKVGGTAGTYKTMNKQSILARFIGLEIEYKYKDIKGEIDAHGTYNLAIRKNVLEEVGGLDESYPKPSGEDFDMTYKISRKHKIMYVPEAIVGHYHPEDFWWYMKNQVRRGFDRIKLYNDNPENAGQDAYTGRLVKYQVWFAGLLLPSLVLIYPFFSYSFMVPLLIGAFLIMILLPFFIYLIKKDIRVALVSIPVILMRNYAWFWGMMKGIKEFGFIKIVRGVVKTGL
ncbi:MAG: glycosyltransferase family 2 protein [bacterium]|nr:glycosyltransferase family 2 protein [bacterium]